MEHRKYLLLRIFIWHFQSRLTEALDWIFDDKLVIAECFVSNDNPLLSTSRLPK